MTQLGVLVLTLFLQATLVSLCAAGLVATARRRAGAALAVLTGLAVLLPAMAAWTFCPLPLPEWQPAAEEVAPRPASHAAGGERAEPAAAPVVPLAALRRSLPRLDMPPESAPAAVPALALLGGVYLVLLAFGVGRLLAGHVTLAALRRRSRPLTDPSLLQTLEQCRHRLGAPCQVALVECPEPGLTAVVGWWRPVILLPPEWRDWTPDECRAALAHELAHATGRHYLVGLVARCAEVVHAYHPLVRRLMRWLRWEQEIAADARAAEALGRGPYLHALARIALSRPSRQATFHAPAMDGGAFSRRIAMLRDGTRGRPLSGVARGLLITALAGVAALALTLRGPVAPAAPPQTADEQTPYDFRYVGGDDGDDGLDNAGVLAFRPARVLTQPGLERLRDWGEQVAAHFAGNKEFRLPRALHLENLDQVVIRLVGIKGVQPASWSLPVVPTVVVIKLKAEADWVALLKEMGGTVTEHRVGGHTCLSLVHPVVSDMSPIHFAVPDRRTLVLSLMQGDGQDEVFVRRVARAEDRLTRPGRETVLTAAIALLLSTQNEALYKIAESGKEVSEVANVLPAADFLGLGLELGETPTVRLFTETANAEAAQMLEKSVRRDSATLLALLDEMFKDDFGGDMQLLLCSRMARELLRGAEIQTDGALLRWTGGRTSVRTGSLIELLGKTVFASK